MYPEPDTRVFDFGGLDKVMEGKHRPGHFNGVAQVVTRLFDIVKPHRAYFGLKDFQQLAIVRKVSGDLHYPVEIVSCPISEGMRRSGHEFTQHAAGFGTTKKCSGPVKNIFHAKSLKAAIQSDEITQMVIEH